MKAAMKNLIAALGHPRAPLVASVLVPVLLGLLSLRMGQDINWDLQNYHWYNPYALLNGRLEADMGPGGWQSYFNPTIDLPYYLMMQALPAPLVGFVMGCVHGLNFVLVLAIARRVLGSDAGRSRLTLLLAIAGVCGAGFLSQLGNTMGDNLTSLLVLSPLYLVLRGWQGLQAGMGRALGLLALSGLLMGLGAGLKLTNATYAAALAVALLTMPLPFGRRLGNAVLYGCAALAGLLASAGYWWLTMWQQFGNPLFPQFNQIFRSPLARQIGVIDSEHLPHNALEALFWPFVFIKDISRVSEIVLRPAVMPALYAAALVFVFVWLAGRLRRPGDAAGAQPRLSPQACFLLVFGLVAYLAWLKLFSIYRYLVPLELLAPLMLWLLIERIAPRCYAARLGGWLLAATSIAVFPFVSWGHSRWAETGISASFPVLAQPASTIVFIGHGDPPMGWLAAFVPPEVRVISLTGGFPESPAYLQRIQAVIASRPGPYYAMLATARKDNPRALQEAPARNHALFQTSQDNLSRYGLSIAEAGCKEYPAAIGSTALPFRLCPVTRTR